MGAGPSTPRRGRWRPYLWLVRAVGLLVPRRLRAQWTREWEAELEHRESVLGRWRRLDARARLELTRRSAGAIADAIALQPRRLEEEIVQDVRFGVRMLLRDKLVTFVGLLALALGIGATTAMFSVVNAVLLRELPYDDPGRVVAILERRDRGPAQITPANFLDWREQQTVFEHLAAYHVREANVAGGTGEPQRVRAAVVSASFFEALGARPLAGRAFLPEEEAAGHAPVAVIGYGLWQRRFGGDPRAVGASLHVDGAPVTVVGVMPPAARFPKEAELWVPPRAAVPELDVDIGDVARVRGFGYLGAIARLAPGVSLEEARAEMGVVTDRLRRQYPETNTRRWNEVVPLGESLVGDMRPALLLLLGAVACVLLVACANVANLLLARATARRRELAIRAAMGASRRRVVRQLLTESVLLALAGGALGVLLAVWGVRLVVAWAGDAIPGGGDVGVDLRVLGFALAVATLTGLAVGLAPAVRASGADLEDALVEGARGATAGPRRGRVNAALVVAEIALSMMLLAGAGLLLQSLARLQSAPLGFETEGIVTMRVAPSGERYADDSRRAAFYAELLRAVAASPGVGAAGAIDTLPPGPGPVNGYVVEGRPEAPPQEMASAGRRLVSPDYFRALGIPAVAGRLFTEREGAEAPGVVVVNQAFARREFPGEDPLGKRVSFSVRDGRRVWLEVVGVVGDVRSEAAGVEPKPEAYLPLAQGSAAGVSLVVRAAGEPAAAVAAVRSAVRELDGDLPVSGVRTMEEVVAGSLSRPSLYATLFGAFAAIALAMAAAGVYGVMAYAVGQRTREIGLRMALGADRARVLRMILGEGARLAGAGLAVGLAAALALSRLLEGLLYGVAPTDAATFAGVTALLGAAALAACYLPARMATAVDPAVALRKE